MKKYEPTIHVLLLITSAINATIGFLNGPWLSGSGWIVVFLLTVGDIIKSANEKQ
jgi:hypothetical protein